MNFYKVKKLGYNIIEIVGIILLLLIIRPGMSYARVKSLGSSSVEVYKGQYIPVSVFSGHKWSIESYDSDIVSVWKTTVGSVVPAIYCKGVNAGTTTIKMSDNTTGMDYKMYFEVKKRDISSGKVVLFQDIVEYSERKITMPVTSVTLNNGNTPVNNYYVTYENNKERGTATVIVHGKGNNYGEIRKKFYIKERDISNGYVTLDQDTFEYNAYEKRPNARLWLSRAGLPPLEVKDVDVRYENNVNAGTARVIVSGKNGNIGRIVKKFTITKRNISSGKIEFKREYIETGHQIKPIRTDIKVCTKTGGEIFDYKIKRYGINKSGYGTITVEGKNNNTGEITGMFRIYKNIMNGEISTFLDCSTYTGKEIKPNATVSYSGIKLTKDIDYTLKYINNVNVGTATIMATGKGFYRGVRMKTFTIKPRNINKTNIVLNNSKYTYTGKAIEPRAIVRDSSRVLNIHHDYEVNYSNNIYAEKPGYSNQAEIIISGIGNYTGIAKKYFNISQRDISGGKIKFTKTYVKTGEQIKPKKSDIEVYAKNGARIYDFEITEYGKNIEESGQITVSGINNNIGTIIGNFKISKKTILNVAEEIHQYMDDVGYGYNTAYLAPTFEESKKYNSVVCSTYVGWVLKELNLLEDNLELNNCKQLEEALLYKMNWQKIPGDKTTLQPGDIIIYGYLPDASGEQHRNHTDIYVGDGKKLNAGHELGPNTKYGHYDSFCEKYITGDLEEGWDRYWVYRPLEYK